MTTDQCPECRYPAAKDACTQCGWRRPPSVLTPDEAKALNHLGHAFVIFRALSAEHPGDLVEFCQAIHKAQNIIMARPTLRALAAEKRAQ